MIFFRVHYNLGNVLDMYVTNNYLFSINVFGIPLINIFAGTTGYFLWVRVYGFIPKEELLKIHRISKVMVLPSFKETFGLVYIEALCQKCRIICSKGQGISKDFINKPFLKVVEPDQIDDIALKIEEHLLEDDFFHVSEELKQFKWDFIINYLHKQCFREN